MSLKKTNYKTGFTIKRTVNLLTKGIKGLLGFCPYHLVVFLKGLGHDLNCLFFHCMIFIIVLKKVFSKNHKKLSLGRVSCGDLSKMETVQIFCAKKKTTHIMVLFTYWLMNRKYKASNRFECDKHYVLFIWVHNELPRYQEEKSIFKKTFFFQII